MDDIIIDVNLIFNKNDIDSGEGFYPFVYNNKEIMTNSIKENYYLVKIYFNLIKYKNMNAWVQMNGNVIIGIEKTKGLELLKYLNSKLENTDNEAILVMNSGGRIIFPITYNSTFRILEQNSNYTFL